MRRTKINTIASNGCIKIMLQIRLYRGFESCYFPLIKHNGYLCGIQHIQIVKVAISSGTHWFNEETQTRNRNSRNRCKYTTQHAPSSNCKEEKKRNTNETKHFSLILTLLFSELNRISLLNLHLRLQIHTLLLFFSFWILNEKSHRMNEMQIEFQSTMKRFALSKWKKK